MGLSRSLSVGASALRANQQMFDVISNNLANSNTIGFKSSRANFQDQLSQLYSQGNSPNQAAGVGVGGVNPLQMGLGVKVGSVQKNMQQGNLEITNRPLDLALQGEGFFIYQDNGIMKYSRAGVISQDRDGYFVDTNSGAYLQGYNVLTDASGLPVKDSAGNAQLSGRIENILIPDDIISQPKQTQNINLTGNLNSSMAVGDQRKTSMNIYDQIGAVHTLEFTFTKNATANTYDIAATVDGNALTIGATQVVFNADGTLNTPTSLAITAADLNTAISNPVFDATTPKDVTVQLANPNQLLSGLTQFAMPSTASFSSQDGYKMGGLENLSVDTEGKIWGAFTNGRSEVLGQVVIAKFTNPEGLIQMGDNMYINSPNSGEAVVGTAGETFQATKLVSNSLEQSNVDITTQFTDMITAQRAFEAASRTITISDQMLAEVNALKR